MIWENTGYQVMDFKKILKQDIHHTIGELWCGTILTVIRDPEAELDDLVNRHYSVSQREDDLKTDIIKVKETFLKKLDDQIVKLLLEYS